MRWMLVSLAAATAVAAVVVWAPAPGDWLGGGPPADSGAARAPAPATLTAPERIQPSAAAAHLRFALDTTDGTAPAGAPASGPAGLATATAPRPPPGPPVLVGLTEGEHRYAYVLHDGQTTRAGLWDKVGKWRVTAIGPQGVTLTAGRQTLRLTFYGPRPEPPAPPPVAIAAETTAPPPTTAAPTATTAAAPAAPRPRWLEPASAPLPHGGGHRAHYWVGPADHAPPGYIVVRPGEAPPAQ